MAKIYLDSGDTFTLSGAASVFGSTGTEKLIINSGATGVEVDQNVERVDLAGASSAFTFQAAGNSLKVYSGTTLVATIPVQPDTDGTQVVFSNGSANAVINATTGAITLGGAAVTSTAGAVTPTTIDATVTSGAGTSTGGTTAGQSFSLTNSATADVPALTVGNDTITGATGTVAATDILSDASTTDNDTANLTITANYTPTVISNIENINLDWDAYTEPTYTLTNVVGAKAITLTSTKVGYLGAATVATAGGNNITAGAGTVGTLTVTGATTGVVVNATNSSAVSVTGTGTGTVNAGAAVTSVTTSGFKTATIDAGTATTIAVTDNAATSGSTTIKVGGNATITNTLTGAETLEIASGKAVSIDDIGTSLTVTGAGDVTTTFTGASALNAKTLTNSKTSGSLTVKSADVNGEDVSGVQANTIWFTGAQTAGTITVANGANLKFSAAASTMDLAVAGTGTTDAVTAEFTAATVTSLTNTGIETLTVKASAPAVSGADLTISTLVNVKNKIAITGTNDVAISAVTDDAATNDAGTIDASALVGTLSVTMASTNDAVSVMGGSGVLTYSTSNQTGAVSATGKDANDVVTANATTTGSVTAILANGDNTVSATGLTTGTLVVVGGTGIDTVTAGAALATGVINVSLGDGANVVALDDGAGAGTRTVTTGGGDDTVTFTGGMDNASDRLTWTAGAGTDTLNLLTEGADISKLVTLTDVEVIQIKADTAGAATNVGDAVVKSSLVSGKTFTIQADAYAAFNAFKVVGEATTSAIDLSTLTISQTLTNGVAYVYTDASANTTTAQTITGTLAKDVITGGSGNDSITAGKGTDTVSGGAGNDTITLTEATADQVADLVNMTVTVAGNGSDTIIGFKTGTDKIQLAQVTTVGTGDGDFTTLDAAVVDFSGQALAAGAVVFDLNAVLGGGVKTTSTADVVEVTTTLSTYGDLSQSSTGVELLKALSSTSTASTGIKAATIGDEFFLVAYQNGNAYIYDVATGADINAIASEITLVATLTGITAGALVAGDFYVA